MSMKSLDVIRDEHRALAAMLSGMRTLVQGIEAGRLKPDYDLFASMIEYIDKVPEKVHHPKENEYLFAKLRLRCAEALPAIEALEEEHRLGDARIATLYAALAQIAPSPVVELNRAVAVSMATGPSRCACSLPPLAPAAPRMLPAASLISTAPVCGINFPCPVTASASATPLRSICRGEAHPCMHKASTSAGLVVICYAVNEPGVNARPVRGRGRDAPRIPPRCPPADG